MITPDEIQNKEFKTSFKGFDPQEVDEFLDQLTLDLEDLLAENLQLKAEKAEADRLLREYKNQEEAVVKTLESAKALMNDISASAEKRADILIKNAELDVEQMLRNARENVEHLKEEEKDLTLRVNSIRSRIKNILSAELERFEDMNRDIFGVSTADAEDNTVFRGTATQSSLDSLLGAQSESADLSQTIVRFKNEGDL